MRQQHFRQMSILRPAPVKIMIVVESEKHKLNSCLVALGGSWWLLVALGYFADNLCFLFGSIAVLWYSSHAGSNQMPGFISLNNLDKQLLDSWIILFGWFFLAIEIAVFFFFWVGNQPNSVAGMEDSWTEPKHGENALHCPQGWDGASQQNRWFILEQSGTQFPILSGDCQQHALASPRANWNDDPWFTLTSFRYIFSVPVEVHRFDARVILILRVALVAVQDRSEEMLEPNICMDLEATVLMFFLWAIRILTQQLLAAISLSCKPIPQWNLGFRTFLSFDSLLAFLCQPLSEPNVEPCQLLWSDIRWSTSITNI